MADTCIVCLGDLATTGESLHQPPVTAVANAALTSCTTNGKAPLPNASDDFDDSSAIAHLLPCGHNLHNECLQPWVERANSCPICRQNFNIVELTAHIGGPVQSTYAVEDKKQVADIDPSMIIDDDLFDEPDMEPCQLCGEFGEDENLLLCDSCSGSCHTYCVGLDDVPPGSWFCPFCVEDRARQPVIRPARRARVTRRRQSSESRPEQSRAWARVWQSVHSRLNLDLDFPFEDEPGIRRTAAQERELAEWQRRFAIAERQGGAARFRDSAAALLNLHTVRSRDTTLQPGSQDELRAWNAFDKARELQTPQTQSSSNRNKRKSVTASPTEPQPEPERRLKRPRTRRNQDAGDASSDTGAESSTARRTEISSPTAVRHSTDATHNGPSFLRSLLREVETTPAMSDSTVHVRTLNHPGSPGPVDAASPASSIASPVPSSHPSPRIRPLSPSPTYQSRPNSPPLTSRIEPIFVQQQQLLQQSQHQQPHAPYSPVSPVELASPEEHEISHQIEPSSRIPRPKWLDPPDETKSSSSRNPSPARREITFSDKAEIQHMVSAALKPEYKKGGINTAQYTAVNRDISRMLYERIGEAGGLSGIEEERGLWQNVAAVEVDAALKKLKKREVPIAA